jgi:hypothetical protein
MRAKIWTHKNKMENAKKIVRIGMSKDFKTIPCYLRKWGESER